MDIKLKIAVLVVLISVAVCLATVVAIVWTLPDLPTNAGSDQICLPREFGSLKCDSLHQYLEKITAKKYAEIKTQDTKRQQEYFDKHRVRLMNIYKKHFWEMNPAAKLTGKEQAVIRKSDIGAEMVPIREWCHGRELHDTFGFERYGIRYRKGRLVVPVDGTYFIYSNVVFFESCIPSSGIPNANDTNKPIKHSIFKFNIIDGEEKEIVSHVQPHVVSRNRYFNSYNSYVSTFEELKAGDEVSVKVSNLTLLKYTPDNYFGINLI